MHFEKNTHAKHIYQHPLQTAPLRHSIPIMAKKQQTTISRTAMFVSLGSRANVVDEMSRNRRFSLKTLENKQESNMFVTSSWMIKMLTIMSYYYLINLNGLTAARNISFDTSVSRIRQMKLISIITKSTLRKKE